MEPKAQDHYQGSRDENRAGRKYKKESIYIYRYIHIKSKKKINQC